MQWSGGMIFQCPGGHPVQVFHRMDRMLKDEAYRSELDALRRRGDGAPEAGGGPRGSGGDPADADEEDGPVSTSEALNMLRQARPPSALGGARGGIKQASLRRCSSVVPDASCRQVRFGAGILPMISASGSGG